MCRCIPGFGIMGVYPMPECNHHNCIIEDIDLAKEANELVNIYLDEHLPFSFFFFFVDKTQQFYVLTLIESNSAIVTHNS